jgi:hypothetical protein
MAASSKDESFIRVTIETLVETGVNVVFEQALSALENALFVICATETEAAELHQRAGTEKLKEHWRGRREAAWSIRRHAEQLEPAIAVLQKLVPATTPRDISGREELKKKVKQAKALGKLKP